MQPAVTSVREQSLASLERLPRLSPLMMQLVAKVTSPMCEVGELSHLIERDPVLAGQVLSIANSALFQRQQRISTVERAVLLIGVGTLRRFALSFSIANLFKKFHPARDFSMTRFNLHSVGTAILAEALARELPVDFPEEAFVAAILHDIGRLLIAVNCPSEFETIISMMALRPVPLVQCERSVLGVDHAELSALAIERWELGEVIQQAVRWHHEPDSDSQSPSKLRLSQIINKADAFTNYLGISILKPSATAKPPSLEFEGFPYPQQRVLEAFETEWKTVGDLFH